MLNDIIPIITFHGVGYLSTPPTESLYQQFSTRSEAERRKVDSEDGVASAYNLSLVHSGRRPEPAGEGKRAKRAQKLKLILGGGKIDHIN